MLVSEIEMKQSKMDECQKFAEQYSVAVKVSGLVPCVQGNVQGWLRSVSAKTENHVGLSLLDSYLFILCGNLSPRVTLGSFMPPPHRCIAHPPHVALESDSYRLADPSPPCWNFPPENFDLRTVLPVLSRPPSSASTT